MDKLKIIGIKKGWFNREIKKHLADIYIKDGKVIVEPKKIKYREEAENLEKRINQLANAGVFYHIKGEEKRDEKGNIDITDYRISKKPTDQGFLGALSRPWFWKSEKFGEYNNISIRFAD